MVGRVLKGLVCFFLLGSYVAMGIDFEKMNKNTVSSREISTLTTDQVREVVDCTVEKFGKLEPQLIEQAEEGNYLAQYYLAQRYGAMARDKFNGEKFALEEKKALLLLISGVRGNFWRSLEELKFAMNCTTKRNLTDLGSKPLPEMEQLAVELALSGKL